MKSIEKNNLKMEKEILRDKVAGAMYGFAIGDAMGATTEFMNGYTIKTTYGYVSDIIGGGWLFIKAGQVTDDTQMMLCVCNALIDSYNSDTKTFEEGKFIDCCKKNFVDWYLSKPIDIGNACRRAIISIMSGKEVKIDTSVLGNGSLMRALPCALLNEVNLNIIQGKLTHNNVICSAYIQRYSNDIQMILENKKLDLKRLVLRQPSGYVADTFYNSLFWYSKNDFCKSIFGAVNHGGDSDTIAAITGGLIGAQEGFNKIPTKFVEKLEPDVKINLDRFIDFAVDIL